MTRIGSMFSGYGGLDLAVQAVLGGDVAWHAELEPAACRILDHHWPDVPNIGDVSAVDWTEVPEVDVLTAGFPCQDLSYAGKGKGITDGTRSGLWSFVAEAARHLRPRLVVLENVAAIVARRPGLDVVLADLALDGWDAEWVCVRASDVGAPHRRERWFLVASDAGCQPREVPAPGRQPAVPLPARDGDQGRAGLTLLSTPQARDYKGVPSDGFNLANLARDVSLLPTPRATDGTKGGPNQRGSSGDLMLPSAVHRLLPTPTAMDSAGSRGYHEDGVTPYTDTAGVTLTDATSPARWGDYAQAIARWERTLGRPAPEPTRVSDSAIKRRHDYLTSRRDGTHPMPIGHRGPITQYAPKPRLAPEFVEWMMGLPAGHVTDVPDVSRNQQLKALGNGVVPQQAAAALAHLLDRWQVAA